MTKFKMIKEKLLSFFKSEKEEVPFKNHISQENDNDYLADDLSDFETENTEEQSAPTYHLFLLIYSFFG